MGSPTRVPRRPPAQANRLLQPAPWIDRLARDYIAKHLGGAGGRFLAVHLRPYPDTCLEVRLELEVVYQLARASPASTHAHHDHTTVSMLAQCAIAAVARRGV